MQATAWEPWMCPDRTERACGSRGLRGQACPEHVNRRAGPGFAGRMGPSGAPGRARQMVNTPVWLDQKQAGKPLSPELGEEEKFPLCPEGHR